MMFGNNRLFDCNWDVNKYKSNYDPEHWDLCKTFMEVHKTKYPEQKLVNLTEAFYQIGVYGSSYDAKTTRMVSALAVDALEGFLEAHPGALKHPFKKSPVTISEVIDLSEDDTSTKRDSNKSVKTSIWDVAVDTNIVVNVLEMQHLQALFKGFIIIYDVKKTSMMNDDKVSILEESFRRSKFGPVHWDKRDTQNTICPIMLALKWKGTVLAEATGANEIILRIRIAQAVINKLANFSQGIEAKWIYYRDGKVPDFFHQPNSRKSNIYKVLSHSQFRDIVEITSYIDTFANSNSFAEIVFGMDFYNHEKEHIIEHVTKSWSTKLTYRSTLNKTGGKKNVHTHVCIYHIHTGEELKRWLEQSNNDNERYRIIPPKDHRRAGPSDNNIREVLKMHQENKETAAEEKRKKEEEEKRKKDEDDKRKKQEENRKREEESRKKVEEQKKKKEEETKKKQEEEKKRKLEEEKKKVDEAAKKPKLQLDKCEEINDKDFEAIFGGFILFYDAKQNSEIDKDDWFSALYDSFKLSNFGELEVISENLRPMRTRCVFVWSNKIVASAEGLTETQAKTAATLQLISKLEPFTYIIQAKEEYFCGGKVPPFLENPDASKGHVFRLMKRDQLPSYYTIFQAIDEFVETPSQCELIFGEDFNWDLKNEMVVYIKAKGLNYRYFTDGDKQPWTHLAVYHAVDPQKLKDELAKSGGESEKYKLIPPPTIEPTASKASEVQVNKVKEKPAPSIPKNVAEKRKEPEKEVLPVEPENKIQIKLKKFKLAKDNVHYPEDTGGDFPGLIIWIGIRKNSTWQRNLFCILLESFRMSKFGELTVEEDVETVWGRKEPLKKCVIKANRKVLAVGLGESKTEAKNSASLQVLRQLRKHCYTIQAKESYFKEGKSTPYDFEPEQRKDNIYRVATRAKFKDRASIIKFTDDFLKTNCNHEVIFGPDFSYEEREAILQHCRQINLNYRLMKCQSTGKQMHTHIAIYHQKPLPTIKAALITANGENDKYRLIPPGGKISCQPSDNDLWPETLDKKLDEADSTNAPADMQPAELQGTAHNVPSNSLIPVLLPNQPGNSRLTNLNIPIVPPKMEIPVYTQGQHVYQEVLIGPQPQFSSPVVYGQPHPDMPLTFGHRQLVYVPIQPNSGQVEPQTTVTKVNNTTPVKNHKSNKESDLRDELSKKRFEGSSKATPENRVHQSSTEIKISKTDSKSDENWSRKVFVNESDNTKKSENRNKTKSPDLREKLIRKDESKGRVQKFNPERRFNRKSRSPEFQRYPTRSKGDKDIRYQRRQSPPAVWQDQRVIRERRFVSPDPTRDIRRGPSPRSRGRRQSPYNLNYGGERRWTPPRSVRDLWPQLAEKYHMDIFMYKYIKQDSNEERDPIALLNATRSIRFNIDFDFVTRELSFDLWEAKVELVIDDSVDIDPLVVGEGEGLTIDEAKYKAACHAVETIQKGCRVIEPNDSYFARGGVPEFIRRRNPMKTHIYEIIQNLEPDHPLDHFTISTMLRMFMSSRLEDVFFLASDFSCSERTLVIQIADQMELWWRVFGERHPNDPPEDIISTQDVCVYKQKSALQLFTELVDCGGSNDKYRLVDHATCSKNFRR